MDHVWVFNGGGQFPAAVFTTRTKAEEWIAANRVEGTLTKYPLDVAVYDWALAQGYFVAKRDDQRTPQFKGRFGSASQEHYHYQFGRQDTLAADATTEPS
jgi:hypothetical protein